MRLRRTYWGLGMQSEWKEYKIAEIADVIGGGTPKTSIDEYWNGTIPWLAPKDLTGYSNVYIPHGNRFITELGLTKSSSKLMPKGTVLLTSRAPIGYVAIAKNEICTNQGFKSLIPKQELCNSEFLYYWIKNNVNYLKQLGTGTTFAEISGSVLKEVAIALPSLAKQEAIVSVLISLDDKIELNRKMNQTLEEMAQVLFKSWFVDFDPVHVKANAKSDEALEGAAVELGIAKEVLELFPSEFEESEMGMIPKGWEVKVLEEVISKANTGADAIQRAPIVDYDTGIKCARIGDFSNNRSIDKWGFSEVAEKNYKNYKLLKNDILVTRTSLIGLSKIIRKDLPAVYNNGLIRIKPKISSEFLYINFQSAYFKKYIARITGESSTRPNMKINYLLNYKVVIPSENILLVIDSTFNTILDNIDSNIEEIQTLQKTRDTLLPKLLSGELDVSNLEVN